MTDTTAETAEEAAPDQAVRAGRPHRTPGQNLATAIKLTA